MVLLSGEPGIGKSRLVRALGERSAASRTALCASVLALLYRHRLPPGDRAARAGRRLPHGTTRRPKLDKLEALLARGGPASEAAR